MPEGRREQLPNLQRHSNWPSRTAAKESRKTGKPASPDACSQFEW